MLAGLNNLGCCVSVRKTLVARVRMAQAKTGAFSQRSLPPRSGGMTPLTCDTAHGNEIGVIGSLAQRDLAS